jgi:hypothetical protein
MQVLVFHEEEDEADVIPEDLVQITLRYDQLSNAFRLDQY